jgi:hypothetical protein
MAESLRKEFAVEGLPVYSSCIRAVTKISAYQNERPESSKAKFRSCSEALYKEGYDFNLPEESWSPMI